jgi:hypothetical protein
MQTQWDGAIQLPFTGAAAGIYVAGPYRGVLHTTESKAYLPSTTSYYGHTSAPHFTLAVVDGTLAMYQHYPIDRSARSLEHHGDIETNRRSAIQIEIAWTAEDIAALPANYVAKLRDWMRWVEAQTGIQRVAPTFYGPEAYGADSPSRMTADQWSVFNGWCGHQHVPQNVHWDPGKIDIQALLAP